MVFIYTLLLENNKYYVGKTNNPDFRLESHFSSNGSVWTKTYKPIKLLELIPDCDNYDEDKYVIKYMEKYGIYNVRGGSFSQLKISDDNVKVLQTMINGSNNKCFICGNGGHFSKDCKSKYKKYIINTTIEDTTIPTPTTIPTSITPTTPTTIPTSNNKQSEKCNCPTSYFSPHRKNKCALKMVGLN